MFCVKCGAEIHDEAVICPKCGCFTQNASQSLIKKTSQNARVGGGAQTSSLKTIAKVFMIIATVVSGFYLIPLAWSIPMTVSYCNKIKNNEPISTGFKVCSLIFVSLIAGILMLCDKDQ